jgi:hypothetical protein
MTWRHGSLGICMAMVCAGCVLAGSANARPEADAPCDRSTQHSFRAQRVSMPAPRARDNDTTVKVRVNVEKKSPWQTLASAMVATMPPNIVDVTASLGEVLLAVKDLGDDNVVRGVDVSVTHKDGAVDLTLDSVDVRPAIAAAPPVERSFRTSAFNVTPSVAVTASVD